MGTLVEEIFSRRVGKVVRAGEIVLCDVDYMMSHDNTTPLAIAAYKKINKPIKDTSKIVVHFDHAYPAPNLRAAEAQKKIVDFIKEQGIGNFFHQGICHQVMIEEGFVTPGTIIIGADSHSTTYGAFGAFSSGFGSTELGVAWIAGKTWFKIPSTIHINLTGTLQQGVYAKDVMLNLAGILTMDGATYKALEFSGPFIDTLPMHERIVFSNMAVELGAKCGLIAPDEETIRFLKEETKARGPFHTIKAIDPIYEKTVELDVSSIIPQVACHPTVDNVMPITDVQGTPIDEVFIGTCTNGRYEDLEIVATILKGNHVSRFTRTIITPASREIYEKAEKNGLMQIFRDSGCTVTQVGCGACIGRHGGILAATERAFTTMNRNFVGRMGSPDAEIYLGSPAAAAVTAINGKITDPREHIKNAGGTQ